MHFLSFRCTHAAQNTPHTCQKSCREGGGKRAALRRGIGKERQEEEEGEGGDEEGGGVFGEDNGDLVDGMIGGRKKKWRFWKPGIWR